MKKMLTFLNFFKYVGLKKTKMHVKYVSVCEKSIFIV